MGEGRTVGSSTQLGSPTADCRAFLGLLQSDLRILFVTVRDKPCKLPKISLDLLFAARGTSFRVIIIIYSCMYNGAKTEWRGVKEQGLGSLVNGKAVSAKPT